MESMDKKYVKHETEIGKVFGDIKIIKFIGCKSNCLLFMGKCQICKRQFPVWIKDLKRNIGTSHSNCVKTIPKGKDNIYVKKLRIIWSHIIDRCTNPKCEKYNYYGGRGISTSYKYFIDFYDDWYDSYVKHVSKFGFKNTTIDRINPYKNYEKNNMRWATWEIQYKNKKWTKYQVFNEYGEVLFIGTAEEISKKFGIKKHYVSEIANDKRHKEHKWNSYLITRIIA